MMFRWTIKQPGIQKFWNLCGLYQNIYDWISPLNKQSGRPFILTQQSMGRNEYGISGHLHIFAVLKHLMVLLRCNVSGLQFYTLSKTLISCIGTCSTDFIKVKTLLDDAFKVSILVVHCTNIQRKKVNKWIIHLQVSKILWNQWVWKKRLHIFYCFQEPPKD